MQMIPDFNNILQKNNLLNPKQHVLLAVSGGVDSIVLFHLMQKIPKTKRPKVSIAHINHQLRPEASKEATFVEQLAEEYDVPFYLYVWEKSKQPTSGVEEAAREMRYAFFKEVMGKTGANVLMTAHHQDDQVETILMKLTRGSTLEQLTGIQLTQAFAGGLLIRPLLPFSKTEIYAFAHQHHLMYFEDESNQGLAYSRNRFRNKIIPLFKEENAKFTEHIEQFAEDLQDLLEIAAYPIEQAFTKLVKKEQGQLSFKHQAFFEHSEAMQRALLQKVLETLYAESEISYKTNYIEIVRDWLRSGAVNTQLDLLENFVVKKTYHEVIFSKKERDHSSMAMHRYLIEELDQWVQLSETEAIGLFATESEELEEDVIDTFVFSANKVAFPLTVRHRQPGDRMTYRGLAGTKKIKDIFIDEKVPLDERDQAWLVEDAKGQILWLISYRQMQLLSEQKTDKLTYILKYKKLTT